MAALVSRHGVARTATSRAFADHRQEPTLSDWAADLGLASLDDRNVTQRFCADGVCLMASNAYERRLGRAIANGEYEGIILELYQETALWVDADTCELTVDPELTVVSGGGGGDGCSVDVVATSPQGYAVSVTASVAGQQTVVELTLAGKYVRREVRDLDPADRDRLLEAMQVTHHVGTEEGVRMFGDAYRAVEWYASIHQKASSGRSCDHWHSNSGFLQQHMAFTLRFEQTLQAVDPRVCMHYWDFTIDVPHRDCCWTDVPLFADDFFSTVDPNNTLHIVDSGRFAFTRIDRQRQWTLFNNAYGLLTAPWNTDPSPFVTRSQEIYGLPSSVNVPDFGCGAYQEQIALKNSFSTFAQGLGGTVHSPAHGMVGGYWNYMPSLIESEDVWNSVLINVSSGSNAVSKNLWRAGYAECPHYCSDDTPAVDCACGLAWERIEKNFPGISAYGILNFTGSLSWMETMAGGTIENAPPPNSSVWDTVLDQMANAGHIGTATNDGSPMDPLFWVIHGIQDRLTQMLRFLNDTGKYGQVTMDQEWQAVESGLSWFDWSHPVASDEFPTSNTSRVCYGHKASDLLQWPNLLLEQDAEFLTNAEYYNMTRPFSPHLPYVYDQLTNWTQCGFLMEMVLPEGYA